MTNRLREALDLVDDPTAFAPEPIAVPGLAHDIIVLAVLFLFLFALPAMTGGL